MHTPRHVRTSLCTHARTHARTAHALKHAYTHARTPSNPTTQGSGFSTNTGGTGNIIKIGQYFCDPIPLHCTVNQIACKTRSALKGATGWNGWTEHLPVSIVVDGEDSECKGTCRFSYSNGGWHTPRVYSLGPMVPRAPPLFSLPLSRLSYHPPLPSALSLHMFP